MKWVRPDPKLLYLTPHFTIHEAVCRHCGRIPEDLEIVIETARFAERVRAETLGGRVMHVNSWCRCPDYNAVLDGAAPNSLHMRGLAIDFTCRDLTPAQVQALCRAHQGKGKLIGGLGSYKSFTHLDRGPARRWRG